MQLAASYLLVLVLALLVTVWGAFLLPLRIAGHLAPVSLLVVTAGNLLLGLAAGVLGGRPGAAGPGLLWLGVALTLGSRREEGDVIIAGGTVNSGYLLLGALAAVMAVALTTSPRARSSR